jgi:heme exporter protein D
MPDLDMSPYAAFVWSAWGISALVVAALIARAVAASRRWKRDLERLEADEMNTSRTRSTRSAAGPEK